MGNDDFLDELEHSTAPAPQSRPTNRKFDLDVTFVFFLVLALASFCIWILPIIITQLASESPRYEDVSKPEWERTAQASVHDVTLFATVFLERLGYRLAGTVDCDRWTWDGFHKQYICYAVVDPAWPPRTVICGPIEAWANVTPFVLDCHFPIEK